jgi:hypothetical protein
MRLEFLTVMNVKIAVFRDVKPCSMVYITFSITNHTHTTLRLNPLLGERPATNSLSPSAIIHGLHIPVAPPS